MTAQLSEAGVTQNGSPTLSWNGMRGLRKSLWSNRLELRGREGRIILVDGAADKEFILRFYNHWRELDPEAAKKNAFDYIDLRKGFAKLLLVVSVVFSLGYGVVATNDAREQFACTSALRAGVTETTARVLKVKRKRATHYIVNLSFQAADGTLVSGGEQLLEREDAEPKDTLPVVYAQSNPKCWSIATADQQEKVNWPQRRFFASYLLMLGLFFVGAGLFGTAVAIRILTEKRLFTTEVADIFGLQI